MSRSKSAPHLNKLSNYPSSPKYSVMGKRKIISRVDDIPAANKYDIRELTTKTSKFGQISTPCSIGKGPRWPNARKNEDMTGPGMYETALSTIRKRDISFGRSTRPPINGIIGKTPGPGLYEVRGRNRRNSKTLSEVTCGMAGRHGWYYENSESSNKPGPGQYAIKHDGVEIPIGTGVSFGTSVRPSIEKQMGIGANQNTGPGQYPVKSALLGSITTRIPPAYSFTTASVRTGAVKKEAVTPDFVLQCTQFG